MEDIQAPLQWSFDMEAQSVTLVTQAQRKEWTSSSLGRELSVVPPIVRRLGPGADLPHAVNFLFLSFCVHLLRSQEAKYHLGREINIPIMTLWYLLACLALPWRVAGQSDVMPKAHGNRQYQSVKRVGIPMFRINATDFFFRNIREGVMDFSRTFSSFQSPQLYQVSV